MPSVTSRFLAKAEEMLPPYRFQVYDVLVLPPSFPYGGMENPCLTFVTPGMSFSEHIIGSFAHLVFESFDRRRPLPRASSDPRLLHMH